MKFRQLLMLSAIFSSALLLASDEWSYHPPTGPSMWAKLSEKYRVCGDGEEQSPVAIPSTAPIDDKLPALVFEYGTSPLIMTNNGHTVQSSKPEGEMSLKIGEETYILQQFHFHSRSEHYVDDNDYAMEVHLVHQNASGSLAVVGTLFKIGETNQVLAGLFNNLPQKKGDTTELGKFILESLLPQSRETYRYSGSLTTPNCRQNVAWNVMCAPIEVSQEQADAMTQLFTGKEFPDGNRRPTQALNNRKVLRR